MYALTGDEAKKGCLQHSRKPDRKVRTEITCPAGFGGVLSIGKTGHNFCLLSDNQGLHWSSPRMSGFSCAKWERFLWSQSNFTSGFVLFATPIP